MAEDKEKEANEKYLTDHNTKSDAVRGLINHEGWQIVDAEIEREIKHKEASLLDCPLDQVADLRGQIKAFKWIQNRVTEMTQRIEEEDILPE